MKNPPKLELIYRIIKENGPLSRNDLSKATSIGILTVAKFIERLILEGKVVESGWDKKTGGRPARLISINPDFGKALGIELGGSYINWVISNCVGDIFQRGTIKVQKNEPIKKNLEDQIKKILNDDENIKSIGIASTGIVETVTGTSLCSPQRDDLNDFPVKKHLEEKFNLPVYLDDVCRTVAYVEQNQGVARSIKNFLYFYLDVGIGLSIVLDGKIYRGPFGISGEIGHFIIDENGPSCGCGNRGCLEVFTSTAAIVRNARKFIENGVQSSLHNQEINIENIINEARRGDKLSYRLITESGERIGAVAAQVINFTGIPLIIFGGRLKHANQLLTEPIQHIIKKNSLSVLSQKLEMKISSLDEWAGALGASMLSLLEIIQ
ncbi:ROK family transcriptional regulator [Atribacter laminatus]|uniref:N-acetylglucosamine repressor n=1 Tax=Atribacter laminatus TaxID=2847778 RepID=A0A7T1ALB8_ATRLM|nr:ROK family protein [Atribacter laminatus]QPM68037.1 N-acetylglucosamine repressor [Atribacter laminatus]